MKLTLDERFILKRALEVCFGMPLNEQMGESQIITNIATKLNLKNVENERDENDY